MDLDVYQKLVRFQTELVANKNLVNKFGNWNYRSAEAIAMALKPLCEKYQVSVTFSAKDIGNDLIKGTATFRDGITKIKVKAIVKVDYTSKSQNNCQAYGSAISYCKKYAYENLFLLDNNKDADDFNTRNGDEAPAITQTPKAETPKAENKPKTILKNNTEDYSNVVDWINNTEGASIVPLKKRFIMTAEMESQLIKLINLNIQK
jgi:hypothetical protein